MDTHAPQHQEQSQTCAQNTTGITDCRSYWGAFVSLLLHRHQERSGDNDLDYSGGSK